MSKILHRVYFGFDGKPDMFQAYKKTWQQQLPDYEIREWNATNLPMDINSYTRQLFEERDHAFLTDYFRWWLLREQGGVYLDADVEITNGQIFDQVYNEMLEAKDYDAFIGIDERGGGWYTAHSMGSKPGSELAEFMCTVYEEMGPLKAWRKKAFYLWAPQLTALYFFNKGHNKPGMGTTPNLKSPTVSANVKIYPQDWFSPLSPTGKPKRPFRLNGLSENTCMCHHFGCSWHDNDSIYASHAQSKGGQTGVMLKDIVAEHNKLSNRIKRALKKSHR